MSDFPIPERARRELEAKGWDGRLVEPEDAQTELPLAAEPEDPDADLDELFGA